MAKAKQVDSGVSVADALNAFVDHLHLSAEALESLIEQLDAGEIEPEDNRRQQDTIMEFGFLPASTGTGSGPAEGDFLLEGSKILTEGPSVPLALES